MRELAKVVFLKVDPWVEDDIQVVVGDRVLETFNSFSDTAYTDARNCAYRWNVKPIETKTF